MAKRTISNTGGNWSDVNTWQEGIVPTISDDIVGTMLSGELTVDVNCECYSLYLEKYIGHLTFNEDVIISIYGTVFLNAVSSMILVNPLLAIDFRNPSVNRFVDMDQKVVTFDDGLGIYLVSYI